MLSNLPWMRQAKRGQLALPKPSVVRAVPLLGDSRERFPKRGHASCNALPAGPALSARVSWMRSLGGPTMQHAVFGCKPRALHPTTTPEPNERSLMATSPSFMKRQKERARQEKKRDKARKKEQRKAQKDTRPDNVPPGEDPDIAGIVPGPQPLPEEMDDA